MELRFLGQAYSTSNSFASTVETENTARFLGQTYTLRRPANNLKSSPRLGLKKYRGVVYGT
ncbi:DUF4278 domain-containing protein [Pleurocapsales cyanobacterium LEGE 10410]|nr:DUF4278 domain-containing protein [Pleurocapsales cyanobacterium LEGE 10410]